MLRSDVRIKRLSVACILVIASLFKWYVTQGSDVNDKLLDDENQWMSDLRQRSSFEYLFLRDQPGYFVIPMRLVLLMINQLGINPATTVRLFVTLTQICCFWVITDAVFKRRQDVKFLTFITLVMIPLEDLNYLHNVGYLFALVIIATWIQTTVMGRRTQTALAFACGFLIVKPLVALIMLTSIFMYVLFFRRPGGAKRITRFESIFCSVSAAYILAYLLMPNNWNSPESLSLVNIGKAIFNYTWILCSVLLPIVNIGGMAFLRLEYGGGIANFSGAFIWSMSTFTCFMLLPKRRVIFSKFHTWNNQNPKNETLIKLVLVSCMTYLSVYSVSNFAWVTIWPLWELAYTPRLWMRWAGNVPILFTVTIALFLLQKNTNKITSYFLSTLIIQYSLLWLFARDFLTRWQGQ